MKEIRKIAVVMFTDIVGYSKIMSENESYALQVLDNNLKYLNKSLKKHNGMLVKNIGDGTAGAIAGAAFLKHFAQGYPWAHIDIAGASEYLKGNAYLPKGASGYGVRLLTQFIRDLDAKIT